MANAEASHSDEKPPLGLLLSQDLFFNSKVTGTAKLLGFRIDVVAQVRGVRDAMSSCSPRCLLVDLSLPGLSLPELMSTIGTDADRPRVIAFGPHVQEALLEEARQAGCDEVLPRSRFSATLPELLKRAFAG